MERDENRLMTSINNGVYFLCFVLFLMLYSGGHNIAMAQNNFSSENELKTEANKLFEQENYVAAYPLYTQLVSVYPKDPNYNYRLGVCMLFSGGDKEKPVPYLELASRSKDVDKEVFFYLAKTYHLNYRFDNAIATYNTFKKVASKSQLQKFEVDRQIAMCNNGKSLLKNITDLAVIDKKELSEEDFFRSYDLEDIGGKLLVKPEDFKSSIDKKQKEKSIIYLSQQNEQIYYSSYGEEGKRGRDIYFVKKQSNGQWSLPQVLPANINTEFDEDYPFLHPNGKSLYFASKGHNSMGGYDIFKSTFDEQTNSWSNPQNLDFAINTPDDDILYVTDSLEQSAYFSSSRLSESGKMAVFKINVARKPVDVSVINGTLVKATGDTRLEAKITVKNIDNSEVIGIFNANSATGEYGIQLPNGGSFLFTVESEGFNSQSETVVVPPQRELRSLRQTISYEPGTGKLIVTNYFDEPISESNYSAALNIIKEKSKLEVNSTGGPELVNSNSITLNNPDNAEGEIKVSGKKQMSNDELVTIANEDAEEAQKEAKELRSEADLAKTIADRRNQEAQSKLKESEQILASAETISDPTEKQVLVSKANTLKQESEAMSKETVVAYNLAKKLDNEAVAKQEEADLSAKYAKDIEVAVKSSNTESLTKLEEQKDRLESLDQQPTGTANAYQSIKKDIESKQKQIAKLSEETIAINKEIPQLQEEAKQLRADAEETKKDDLKQGMIDQANEIDVDVTQMKQQAEQNEVKVSALEAETQNLQVEADLVNKLVGEIQTGSEIPPPVVTVVTAVDYSDKYSGELAKAEAISNEYDREIAKATANKEWSEAIKKDIAKKKEQIKNARIQGQKQALTEKVNELEQQLKDKDKAVQESTVKAEQAKQQQEFAAVAEQYNKQLNDTSQAVSASEKERIIATANDQWAAAIDKNIEQKKQQLIATKDPKAKTDLETEIKNLEVASAYKRKISKESFAKAEQLKQEEELDQKYDYAGQVNTAAGTAITPVNYTEAYSTELSDAEAITDDYEKEVAKAVVNKKWEMAIQKDLDEKKDQLVLAKKKKERDLLAGEVAKLDQQLKQKQAAQQQNFAKLEDIKDEKNAEATAKAEAPETYVYSSSKAAEKSGQAQGLVQESGNLKAQANTERENAEDISDPIEKDKTIRKAEELEKQAQQKQFEAAKISADINKEEFTNNDSNLEEISRLAVNNKADDISIAELSKDEAKIFFSQAQKLRGEADTTSDLNKKQDLLDRAGSKETQAFERQQKAKEIYVKNYPDFVFKSDVNKPVAPAPVLVDATPPPTEQKVEKVPEKTNPVFESDVSAKSDEDNNEQKQNNTSNPIVNTESETTPPVAEVTETATPPPAQVSNENLEEIRERKEFKDFSALRAEAEAALKDAKSQYKTAEDLRNTGEEQIKRSQQLLAEADRIQDENKKQAAYEEAISLANQAKNNLAKSDSVYEFAKNEESAAKSKKDEADLILQTVDEATANGMLELVGEKLQPRTSNEEIKPVTIITAKDRREAEEKRLKEQREKNGQGGGGLPIAAETSLSKIPVAAGEFFSLSSTSIYSPANPIPLDSKLPDGLIYKVQLGAFKNAIPQDIFKGISPIMGETTPKGFIRYTAGIFVKYETADAVKEELKRMGFKDAFVVAFNNGKRIPLGGATVQPVDVTVKQPVIEQNNVVQEKPKPTQPDNTDVIAAQATDLTTTNGLVYTVQVGVYSKNANAAKLKNIKPLLREDLPNGSIRFTTGKYSDVNLAIIAKNSMVLNNGIKDAFVTVYYNGKRISIAEASKIENGGTQNDAQPKKNIEPSPADPKTVIPPDEVKKPVVEEVVPTPVPVKPVKPEINNTNNDVLIPFPADSGVVFRVQLGAYKAVPLDVANRFLKISKWGINNYKDEKGLTIFTVGATTDYEKVNQIKKEVLDAGVKDAFLIAFYYGQKITIVQANTILNQ